MGSSCTCPGATKRSPAPSRPAAMRSGRVRAVTRHPRTRLTRMAHGPAGRGRLRPSRSQGHGDRRPCQETRGTMATRNSCRADYPPDCLYLRPRLLVISPSVAEVVRFAGGWVCDQAMAGWHVRLSRPPLPRPATMRASRCSARRDQPFRASSRVMKPAFPATIADGASDMCRNITAERILGLSRQARRVRKAQVWTRSSTR